MRQNIILNFKFSCPTAHADEQPDIFKHKLPVGRAPRRRGIFKLNHLLIAYCLLSIAHCLLPILAHAQDNRNVKDSFLFEPTAIGQPVGEKNSTIIDKEGGRLISADKKIELVIPEGALETKTTISIQPITNTSIDGVGKGYGLEPSGTQFQIPVQLIFHYTEKDMEDGSPQLMAIAMQNEKGVWYGLKEVKLDTVSKTITGNIKHFSAWALSWGLSLRPAKTRVKVSKSVDIKAIPRPVFDEDRSQRLEVYQGIFGANHDNPIGWYANLVLNGDADNGTFPGSDSYPFLTWTVTYKAPAKVPSKNPVEIMLAIVGAENGIDGQKITFFKRCYIKVYDGEYEVKMESVMKSGGKAVWGGIRTATDKGSFIVSLENNKPALINIVNNLEVMTNDCKNKILNPTTCTGLLHVVGIKGFRVTPANPPGQPYPTVEIWFVPFPIEFSIAQFLCPPPPSLNDRGMISGNELAGLSKNFGSALPWDIKFLAKDGEQIIIESPKDSEDGYLKIWVRKIKDD